MKQQQPQPSSETSLNALRTPNLPVEHSVQGFSTTCLHLKKFQHYVTSEAKSDIL